MRPKNLVTAAAIVTKALLTQAITPQKYRFPDLVGLPRPHVPVHNKQQHPEGTTALALVNCARSRQILRSQWRGPQTRKPHDRGTKACGRGAC